MTTLLKVCPSSSLLYEVAEASSPVWIGFVFAAGVAPPAWGYFPVAAAWTQLPGMPSFAGFFVFAPKAPGNPAAFVAAIRASAMAQPDIFQGLTIPVWLADPDAVPLAPIYIPTAMASSPIIPVDANLGFGGNFSFLIPANSYYGCDPDSETLSISAQQNFIFNVNGFPITGFDPALVLPLSGPEAGMLALNAVISFDPTPAGGDLAFHYNYRSVSGISQIRYPLFDIGAAGPKLSVAVTLDPSAPFDGVRTRFSFRDTTLGQPIPSGLQSPLGQSATLTPLPGSALVIRPLYGSTAAAGGMNSGFEPDGPFALALDPPTAGGALALMPGLAGSECMAAPSGTVLNFAAGASFCPYDPTLNSADTALPLDDMDGNALTAWISVQAQNGQATYSSQPPQSAFYVTDASIADYLFLNKVLPILTGASLPAAPFAAYGLITEQLGAKVDVDAYQAFERHAASQVRRRIMANGARSQRIRIFAAQAQSESFATGRGLVANSNDGGQTFQSVDLASTVDSEGGQHIWSLDNVGEALSLALRSASVFLVADRTVQGGTKLFDITGTLAFADWQLAVSLDGSVRAPDQTKQILILKFAPGSVATLVGQLGAWTDASIFLDDPVAVQGVLLARIAAIQAHANGQDAELAALYGPLAKLLNDPSWNGVLAFSPIVEAEPAVVEGIISTLPDQRLTAVVMGIAINALSGGGPTPPAISASAPFALIDYELPPPTTGGAGSADAIADFEVDYIRARFQNGAVASFAARATLTINALFGLPVAQQQAGKDAASNAIAIVGTYQTPTEPGGQGTYSFAAASPSLFRFAYEWYQGNVRAAILDRIVIEAIQFLPVSADATKKVSRFAMSGNIAFAKPNGKTTPPGLSVGGDLFDYDALSFVNLGLLMTEKGSTGGAPDWGFDVTQAGLSAVAPDALRQGLAMDLPLALVRMAAAGTLDQYGCQALQVPTGWTPPSSAFDFALIYSLDLGRPGAFAASSADLTATLVLGWSAEGDYALGFGLSGLGQQRQLTLQGVMQLGIGPIGIAPLPQGDGTRLGLILNQCQIGYLGTVFPPVATRFEVALIGAPPYPTSRLVWFASSGQPIPPRGRA